MYWVVLGEAFNCQLLFAELRNVWCVGTVNFRHIEISVAFEVAYFSFHADVWALFLKRKNCFFECTTEHLWHTVCTVSISYPVTHNIKKLVSVITLTGYVRDTEHMDFTLVNHHPVRTFQAGVVYNVWAVKMADFFFRKCHNWMFIVRAAICHDRLLEERLLSNPMCFSHSLLCWSPYISLFSLWITPQVTHCTGKLTRTVFLATVYL